MTATHGFWFGLALGLTFALGFAAAVLVLPRAEAQTAPATRWRYMTIAHGWDGGRWANEAAESGWRFVGFDQANSHALIFERPRD